MTSKRLIYAGLEPVYLYKAWCVRVKDGDTFVARIDLGFDPCLIEKPVRLAGINAPELHGETAHEGRAASIMLGRLILGSYSSPVPLILESHKDERSFERWVCDVWLRETGESVQDLMVERGAAVRVAHR